MMKCTQIIVQVVILVLNITCIIVQGVLEHKDTICPNEESACASNLEKVGEYYQQKICQYITFMPASVSFLSSATIACCMYRKKDRKQFFDL